MAQSISLSLPEFTTSSKGVRVKVVTLLKTLGTLTLLLIALPFNALIVLIDLLWGYDVIVIYEKCCSCSSSKYLGEQSQDDQSLRTYPLLSCSWTQGYSD